LARGRMISKQISLDEKVDDLSDDTARLLFTWMIPHLDREGRIYGDANIFKSIVAPRRKYSDKKIEKYLLEMEQIELIERYFVNNNAYIYLKNFEKHQLGLRKEKEAQSQIPPITPELGRSKDGVTPAQEKRKEKKIKRKEGISKKESIKNNFIIFWEAYPRKIAKIKAEGAFEKINPDETLLAIMIESINRSKSSRDWQKSEGQYIPYPASWLNNKRWEDKEPVRAAPQADMDAITDTRAADDEILTRAMERINKIMRKRTMAQTDVDFLMTLPAVNGQTMYRVAQVLRGEQRVNASNTRRLAKQMGDLGMELPDMDTEEVA